MPFHTRWHSDRLKGLTETAVQSGATQRNWEFLEKASGITGIPSLRVSFLTFLFLTSLLSLAQHSYSFLALLLSQPSHLVTRPWLSLLQSLQWPLSFSLPSMYQYKELGISDLTLTWSPTFSVYTIGRQTVSSLYSNHNIQPIFPPLNIYAPPTAPQLRIPLLRPQNLSSLQ